MMTSDSLSESNNTVHYDDSSLDNHTYGKQQFQAIINFFGFVVDKRKIPLEQQSLIMEEFIT